MNGDIRRPINPATRKRENQQEVPTLAIVDKKIGRAYFAYNRNPRHASVSDVIFASNNDVMRQYVNYLGKPDQYFIVELANLPLPAENTKSKHKFVRDFIAWRDQHEDVFANAVVEETRVAVVMAHDGELFPTFAIRGYNAVGYAQAVQEIHADTGCSLNGVHRLLKERLVGVFGAELYARIKLDRNGAGQLQVEGNDFTDPRTIEYWHRVAGSDWATEVGLNRIATHFECSVCKVRIHKNDDNMWEGDDDTKRCVNQRSGRRNVSHIPIEVADDPNVDLDAEEDDEDPGYDVEDDDAECETCGKTDDGCTCELDDDDELDDTETIG